MPNGGYTTPLLRFNLNDFLQCLEVEPRTGPHVWTFDVRRAGLVLLLTVHDVSGTVHITLQRDGGQTLIDFEMTGCRGVQYVERGGVECLEFAPARLYKTSPRFDDQYLIDCGVRVSVRPDISIRFFDDIDQAVALPLIKHLS